MKLTVKFGITLFILLLNFSLCVADDSINELIEKANQGDAQAQYKVGRMYDNCQSETQNYAEAMKWYKKSADQGYDNAQYKIGVQVSRFAAGSNQIIFL